ncbi:hypothetical protein B0T18DRAFT_394079 [Schizothecium vesticola]|uniref:Zn(2)-C6 fungal-type domain-containing protein n=1 Tax=Schizothecium vesticola TaxID=314040 RepID=A0AA40K0J6_9PEZI|nr:hypothetical protein B0T18DRAFT_394079 [Schizothecium vesticola]
MASTDAQGRTFRASTKAKHQHHLSCDRCRGQKLKCVRSLQGPLEACERCQKAGARCLTDQSVRMGRPPKRRERRETTASSHESQATCHAATMGWASQHEASPKGLLTSDSVWFGYLDDARLDTVHVQHQGQDLQVDLGLHDAGLDDDPVCGTSASASDDWFDGGGDFDNASPPPPSTSATSYSTRPSPFIALDAANITSSGSEKLQHAPRMCGILAPAPAPAPQDLMERICSLNINLHQQTAIASQIASDYTSTDPSLLDPQKDMRLSFAVDSMIQGLQTFHALLLQITADPSPSPPDHTQQQQTTTTPSRFIARSCAPSLFWFTGGRKDSSTPEPNTKPPPRTSPGIDLPTSLMLISCHINLIHLCRHVFAGIRAALSHGHHRTLPALSSCQIGGVAIAQESNLQLMILVQVVARMVNKIGVLLGYPFEGGCGEGGRLWYRLPLASIHDLSLCSLRNNRRDRNPQQYYVREEMQQPPRLELHVADKTHAEPQKSHLETGTPPAGDGEESAQRRVERDEEVAERRVLHAEPPKDGLVVVRELGAQVAGEGRREAGGEVSLDADKVEAGKDYSEVVAEVLGGGHHGWCGDGGCCRS